MTQSGRKVERGLVNTIAANVGNGFRISLSSKNIIWHIQNIGLMFVQIVAGSLIENLTWKDINTWADVRWKRNEGIVNVGNRFCMKLNIIWHTQNIGLTFVQIVAGSLTENLTWKDINTWADVRWSRNEGIVNVGNRFCMKMNIKWASSWHNLSSGSPWKRESNQSPQLQRRARKLKFRLKNA